MGCRPAAAARRHCQAVSTPLRGPDSLPQQLRIQVRVIGALLLRELVTRFGRENLGYTWIFAEPLILGLALGALHHISGHALPGGLPVVVFWVTGYMPFYLLRGLLNRAPGAVTGNQSLLYHRRITLLDVLIARNLLEGAAVSGAMLIFLMGFGMALDFWPDSWGTLLLGMVILLAMTHGAALILAALSIWTEMIDRVVHLFTYLSLPFTGSFFMVFWLPSEAQQAALLIPSVHCFEMVRHGLFGTAVPTHYDLTTMLTWVVGLNLSGMLLLRIARRDLMV